ncbi:MAG TPA: glycoside hydrolase family 35 protein, partial [Gemmatimonadales bacterium]|nr:glycoside hydrolase family 35 protein [Gemmatimonadales bacterium]
MRMLALAAVALSYQLSAISYQPTAIRYQLSAISYSVDTAGSTRHAPLATHSLPATRHSPPVRKHRFTIAKGRFLLDGRPFQILSGELHYARIPRAYWAERLAMAKAMGLNAVSVYVFWNFHETRRGHFDWTTDEHDLGAFLDEAKKQGLWVILRPGPYVCAEWDFGGYPSYLARDTSLKVRTRDPRFLAVEKRYIRALAKVITPRLVTHGGPVVLVQVENEYGSFGSDHRYLQLTRQMFQDAGFNVPLFTADGDGLFDKGAIPGVLPGANGETNYDSLVARVDRFHRGKGPYFVPEFYPGWLDHWGEKFVRVATRDFIGSYDTLISRGASVNLYMFHGGTNFGFTSGANSSADAPIQPSLTSYDYDAPLDEAGHPTPKYYALRALLAKRSKRPLPPVPTPAPVISIPDIPLSAAGGLYDLVDTLHDVHARRPLTFEELGQRAGYVLYRHQVDSAAYGMLEVPGLRDFGLVFVNGRRVAMLDRRTGTFSTVVDVPARGELEILVESEGRINYGPEVQQNRKGIISPVRLAGTELKGWRMARLPFDSLPAPIAKPAPEVESVPTLYRGSFTLDSLGDSFLDLRGWGKGIVFVNGHNLGRYWDVIGPQRTLYLPGPWLRKGQNDIAVFEQLNDSVPGHVAGLT